MLSGRRYEKMWSCKQDVNENMLFFESRYGYQTMRALDATCFLTRSAFHRSPGRKLASQLVSQLASQHVS